MVIVLNVDEPQSFEDAVAKDEWHRAMHSEMDFIKRKGS
jgi:hypothetical protein